MPRLVERIQAAATAAASSAAAPPTIVNNNGNDFVGTPQVTPSYTSENSSTGTGGGGGGVSSDGTQVSSVSDLTDCYNNFRVGDCFPMGYSQEPPPLQSPAGGFFNQGMLDFQAMEQSSSQWLPDGGVDMSESLWNGAGADDLWFLQQQLN